MISGIVPFEEIVQSIKDETGIENIRPFYEKIRRLIFRAEREIGYGGSVELMKKTYVIAGVSNIDPNFGKFFKFPEDLIELEGIGQDCQPVIEYKYRPTSEGIRFKEKQTVDTVLLYWGLKTDDNGYPMVTRNHEEAVISFILWKLYSAKIFLGIGNMNAAQDYKMTFNLALAEARGDDAFPTLEQWNTLGQLSYTDRRTLIDQDVHSYDYCAEYEDEISEPILEKMIKYWQIGLTDTIESETDLIDLDYIEDKPEYSLKEFKLGKSITFSSVGKIVFLVTNTENDYYSFKDALGNNIDNAFDSSYIESLKLKVYVSKNLIAPSEILFKIENL
jgi:hypothetical protein